MKQILLYKLIGIFFLLLVVTIILWEEHVIYQTDAHADTKSILNITMDTNKWSTYNNNEYNYSLKYPEGWKVVNEYHKNKHPEARESDRAYKHRVEIIKENYDHSLLVSVWTNSNEEESLNDWIKKYQIGYFDNHADAVRESNAKIAGLDGYVAQTCESKKQSDGKIYYSYLTYFKDHNMVIKIKYKGENIEEFWQILATLVYKGNVDEDKNLELPVKVPYPIETGCFSYGGGPGTNCSDDFAISSNDCCGQYTPYPSSNKWFCSQGEDAGDRSPHDYGNCVWWAAYTRSDIGNAIDSVMANQWDDEAVDHGFLVDDCTRIGDILVDENNHVAHVTSLHHDSVDVSEMSYCDWYFPEELSCTKTRTNLIAADYSFIHTNNKEVVFYWDDLYMCNGKRQIWRSDTGTQNMDSWFDNQATGIRIPSGWAVKVSDGLNGTGNSLCLTSDDGNLSDNTYAGTSINVNDSISSFTVYHEPICGLPIDLTLENQTIIGQQTLEAQNSITARNNYNISSMGNVSFRAGNQIKLEPGFSAVNGCTFHAEIDSSL